MSSFELIVRVLAAFQFILLIGVFASAPRRDHLPAAGLLLSAAILAFIVSSARGADEWLGLARWPVTALCVTKPVALWIFARALFADRFTMTARDAAALVIVAALGLWHEAVAGHGETDTAAILATLLLDAAMLGFVLLTPLELWQQQRADLDSRRRLVRRRILPLAVVYLGVVLVWQAIGFLANADTPRSVVILNLAVLWAGGLVAFLAFIRVDIVDWLSHTAQADPAKLTVNERAVLARLHRLMSQSRWYSDPSLSIPTLARRLATNEQSLRNVIHSGLGCRNFNQFLHRHRLEEATRRLGAGDGGGSVLAIALDSGFSSIGPFNRAFRALHGVTPTEYRATCRARTERTA